MLWFSFDIPVNICNCFSGEIYNATLNIKGKHPIMALNELCAKMKWDHPTFKLVKEDGLPHEKKFQMQVGFSLLSRNFVWYFVFQLYNLFLFIYAFSSFFYLTILGCVILTNSKITLALHTLHFV